MKKIFFSVLFLIVCFSLSSCGDVNYAAGEAYMVPSKDVAERS